MTLRNTVDTTPAINRKIIKIRSPIDDVNTEEYFSSKIMIYEDAIVKSGGFGLYQIFFLFSSAVCASYG